MRLLTLVCLAALAAPPAPASAQAPPSPRRLIFGGDAAFPPYEYLDAAGQPRGLNVELMRLLSRESGTPIEIRLGDWRDVIADFEAGRSDVVSLALSPAREERFDMLVQTWTLSRGFLFRAGRTRYPGAIEDLTLETVAVPERGAVHEALLALAPSRRPLLRPARNQAAAVAMLARGEATAVGGNTLTLRFFANEIGLADVVAVELEPYAYYLAAAHGRRELMQPLVDSFASLRDSGEYYALLERSLVLPGRPRSWRDYWRPFALLLASLLALATGTFAWTRSLRREVGTRTRALARSLEEKEKLAAALAQSEERFRGMIEGLRTGVVLHARGGEILFANPAALSILQVGAGQLLGCTSIDRGQGFVSEDGERLPPERDPVRLAIAGQRPVRDVLLGISRGVPSERAWLIVSAEPELGPGGVIEEVICTFADVTERRHAQEQIRYLAYHDSLTGLPNRELFLDRLRVALAHAQRHRRELAVLFVDLDHFKVINDSLGHSIGDRVLREIAARLRATLREEDTVARLGGDEFTALLPSLSAPTDVSHVAAKIQQAIRQPIQIDGRELGLSASIGVGLFPNDGSDAETLLKNADTAMYRAKELGRDQHQFYTAALSVKVLEHLDLDGRLRKALQNDRLLLHYQPLIDLADGRVEAVEALVRWQDSDGSLIPPDDFIPVAEVTGLIVPIGAWVLRAACAEIARLAAAGGPPRVSVNLSARQFHGGEVVEQVKAALAASGLRAEQLELEITETVAMQDQERTVETLRRLKQLGVRISIDDFGTGYSSLGYLRRFPIDTLKIDRSFVRDVASDRSAASIAAAVIAVGHELRIHVVAEGVETEEQLRILRRHGCDAAQGFLVGRPAPAAELVAALADLGARWPALIA
ncbi:MAG: EAL domain-containing protein [Vicinamibacteria bacterium]